MKRVQPFWQLKTLEQMTTAEWESLCDGCAKCCVHKIEDISSGTIFITDVACRLLELHSCQCKKYDQRSEIINDCIPLTPKIIREINWLPDSCAYRRLVEGRGLAWWHPLVSGDPQTVLQAGISVCGKVVPEEIIDLAEIEERIVGQVR